jgi:pantoate--beta-alanine ligase
VRAADGLALSSRNKYLSPEERTVAPVLYRALAAGAAAASGGPGAVLAAAQAVLGDPVVDDTGRSLPAGTSPRVDYLALVDGRNYAPVRDDDLDFRGTAVLAIAARVGTTRLIDNVIVNFFHSDDPDPSAVRSDGQNEKGSSDFGAEPHAADD